MFFGQKHHLEAFFNKANLGMSAVVRFPNPLAFGSGLGERTPKKEVFQVRRGPCLIISASSVFHQCIIIASTVHYHRIISASSASYLHCTWSSLYSFTVNWAKSKFRTVVRCLVLSVFPSSTVYTSSVFPFGNFPYYNYKIRRGGRTMWQLIL